MSSDWYITGFNRVTVGFANRSTGQTLSLDIRAGESLSDVKERLDKLNVAASGPERIEIPTAQRADRTRADNSPEATAAPAAPEPEVDYEPDADDEAMADPSRFEFDFHPSSATESAAPFGRGWYRRTQVPEFARRWELFVDEPDVEPSKLGREVFRFDPNRLPSHGPVVEKAYEAVVARLEASRDDRRAARDVRQIREAWDTKGPAKLTFDGWEFRRAPKRDRREESTLVVFYTRDGGKPRDGQHPPLIKIRVTQVAEELELRIFAYDGHRLHVGFASMRIPVDWSRTVPSALDNLLDKPETVELDWNREADGTYSASFLDMPMKMEIGDHNAAVSVLGRFLECGLQPDMSRIAPLLAERKLTRRVYAKAKHVERAKPKQEPAAEKRKPAAKAKSEKKQKPATKAKPGQKSAVKPEQKPAAKAKSEQKPGVKPEQKPAAKAKPEQKPAAKPEQKPKGQKKVFYRRTGWADDKALVLEHLKMGESTAEALAAELTFTVKLDQDERVPYVEALIAKLVKDRQAVAGENGFVAKSKKRKAKAKAKAEEMPKEDKAKPKAEESAEVENNEKGAEDTGAPDNADKELMEMFVQLLHSEDTPSVEEVA